MANLIITVDIDCDIIIDTEKAGSASPRNPFAIDLPYGAYAIECISKENILDNYTFDIRVENSSSCIQKAVQIKPIRFKRLTSEYDFIGNVINGYIIVKKCGTSGYINENGDYCFDVIRSYYCNRAVVVINDKYGVIDEHGNIVTSPRYDYISDFHENYARVSIDDKFGVINVNGEEIIMPKYDWITSIKGNFFIVQLNYKYGIINKNGDEILPPIYTKITGEDTKLIVYSNYENWMKYTIKAILPTNSNNAINLFDIVERGDEYYVTYKDNLKGVLSDTGYEIIPPTYTHINCKHLIGNIYAINGSFDSSWHIYNGNLDISPIHDIKEFQNQYIDNHILLKNSGSCFLYVIDSQGLRKIGEWPTTWVSEIISNDKLILIERGDTLKYHILNPLNGQLHQISVTETDIDNDYCNTIKDTALYYSISCHAISDRFYTIGESFYNQEKQYHENKRITYRSYVLDVYNYIMTIDRYATEHNICQIREEIASIKEGVEFCVHNDRLIYYSDKLLYAVHFDKIKSLMVNIGGKLKRGRYDRDYGEYETSFEGGKWGWIQPNGELSEVIFNSINRISSDLLFISTDNRDKIITSDNRLILEADIIDREKSKIKKNGKFALIDKQYHKISPLKYNALVEYGVRWNNTDLWGGQFNNKWCLINTDGYEITDCIFDSITQESSCLIVQADNKYGLFDLNGDNVAPIIYDYICCAIERGEYFKVKKGDKVGIIRSDKKLIVPIEYDRVDTIHNNSKQYFFKVVKDKLVGCYNGYGELIVPVMFEQIALQYNNVKHITVKENGLYGCYNSLGNLVVPILYDKIDIHEENEWICVTKDKLVGAYSITGEQIIPVKYDSIQMDDSTRLIIVTKNALCGCFDHRGKLVIPIDYDECNSKYRDLVCVKKNGRYGCYNLSGETIVPVKYDHLRICEKCIIVKENNLFGVYSYSGELVIPINYNEIKNDKFIIAKRYKENIVDYFAPNGNPIQVNDYVGFATHRIYFQDKILYNLGGMKMPSFLDPAENIYEGLWGIATENRIAITPPIYQNLIVANEDLIAACKDEVWGYIDSNNNIVIEFQYDDVRKFNQESTVAAVCKNGKWGYIDVRGNVVIELKYDSIGDFRNGMAVVSHDGKYGCIDIKGNVIHPLIYEYISEHYIDINRSSERIYKFPLVGKSENLNFDGDQRFLGNDGNVYLSYGGHCVIDLNSKAHIILKDGRISPVVYDGVYKDSTDEYIHCKIDDKHGVVSGDGNIVIPFIYDKLALIESYIICLKDNKWGVLNFDQNIVIPFIYNSIQYKNGFLANNKYYIDKEGLYKEQYIEEEYIEEYYDDDYNEVGCGAGYSCDNCPNAGCPAHPIN